VASRNAVDDAGGGEMGDFVEGSHVNNVDLEVLPALGQVVVVGREFAAGDCVLALEHHHVDGSLNLVHGESVVPSAPHQLFAVW